MRADSTTEFIKDTSSPTCDAPDGDGEKAGVNPSCAAMVQPTAAKEADALNDEGVRLARNRKFGPAVEYFRRAVAADPGRVSINRNLARAYADAGHLSEAEKALARVAELEPEAARSFADLGRIRRRLTRAAEAAEALRRAHELEPNSVEILQDLGLALGEAKRHDEAKACYEKALQLDPDQPEVENNLGVLLQEMGRLPDAIEHLERSVELRPAAAGGLNNLGVALAEQRNFERAVEFYQKALAVDASYTVGWNNLGNSLRAVGRYAESIASLERAILLKPDYAEAYNNLAIAHLQIGHDQAALEYYNKALFLRPNYPEAHMNRGLGLLALGWFKEGWADYEWRWQLKTLRRGNVKAPFWDGGSLIRKTIVLHYEQGLGDTFQFIRYAAKLKERGANVIFHGQPPTQALLSRTPGIDQFVPRGQPLPPCATQSTLLSLPGLVGTALETIPSSVPYIFADTAMAAAWKPRLEQLHGFTVGIAWQGNPEHRGDRQRSIPLKLFASVAAVPDARLVSLQRNFGSEQVAELNGAFRVATFEGIDDKGDGFSRTAAIVDGLDLVLSADTAVAHLAAAMGKAVWLLLPYACDWRWLRSREDSPWYPTMRLFRQADPGDWAGVFERVEAALREQILRKGKVRVAAPRQTQDARPLLHDAARHVAASEFADAKRLLAQAADIDPENADVQQDWGVTLAKSGDLTGAIARFRRAIELRPQFAQAFGNLGLAFLQNDQIDESVAHLRRAIEFGSAAADVHNNLGVAVMRQNQPHAAIEHYFRALHIRPDYSAAHYNLARAYLACGMFGQGWLEHEWRKECLPGCKRVFTQPQWTGTSLRNRSILLYCEQGLGDTLQFIRYAQMVKARGAEQVIVECQPQLQELIGHLPYVDQAVAPESLATGFDLQVALMSLPRIFDTDESSVPAAVPYITADATLAEKWKHRLGSGGVKVGIAWQGNPHHQGDRLRSIQLGRFSGLAEIGGVQLISLQRGFGAEQLGDAQGRFLVAQHDDFEAATDGFMRTAALIQNLDLVIAVDTAVAHLAGAMGIATWVLLPFAPDWRWLNGGDSSAWYPTMRLFRQSKPGDWDGVFKQAAKNLQALTERLRPPASANYQGADQPKIIRDILRDGSRFFSQGMLGQAADAFRRALAIQEDSASAHHDLAITLARQKRLPEAITHLQQAISLDPTIVTAYGNLALAFLEMGEFKKALPLAAEAVKRSPESAELRYRLAMTHARLGQFPEAVEHLERAVDLQPSYAQAWYGFGALARDMHDATRSVSCYRRALEIRPDWPEAQHQLGLGLAACADYSGAVDAYERALALSEAPGEIYFHLGVAQLRRQNARAALEALQRAVYLRPTEEAVHNALADALLKTGETSRGFLEYQWRFRKMDGARPRTGRRWDGGPVTGKRLLVFDDAPVADWILLLRYVRAAKQAGARVAVACPEPIVPLAALCGFVDEVSANEHSLPACDLYCRLSRLPVILPHIADSADGRVPCLAADAVLSGKWRATFSEGRELPLGCIIDGAGDDAVRTAELDGALRRLAGVPAAAVIARVKIEADASDYQCGVVESLDAKILTLSELAAMLSVMPLVATSNALVADLAGALGVPTFFHPTATEQGWHWQTGRENTLWYPGTRVAWPAAGVPTP